MVLLLFLLDRKVGSFDRLKLLSPALKIFLSGGVTAVALYIPIKLLDQLVFDTTRTINLLMLTSISSAFGLSVYLFLSWFLDIPQMATLFKVVKRMRGLRPRVFIDTTSEMEDVQEAKI